MREISSPKSWMLPCIGAEQSVDQLEQDALAHAGRAEQNARLARRDGEGDVLQDRRPVEGDGDVAKDHNRLRSGWRS